MIRNRETVSPPKLHAVTPLLEKIPRELHGWITEKHIQYLDDRIHKIGPLTDYLANCRQVDQERNAFLQFVLDWTRKPEPDLSQYLQEYAQRFGSVRIEVEKLCDEFLRAIPTRIDSQFVDFWRRFAAVNELDSVHGMFLTSGRWYVNVMLPPVKELIYCLFAGGGDANAANDLAYHVARRVITPRFAETPTGYDHSYERRFGSLFMPILQHFDRKLCFLFEVFAQIPDLEFASLQDFAADVAEHPSKYNLLLEQGVYPPFGWHELHASRKARKPVKTLQDATAALFKMIPTNYHQRAQCAIDALAILKEYELNYNNFNYKGAFGLVSKYQYWVTMQLLKADQREPFLDAILLDRFFDALAIVEHDQNQ